MALDALNATPDKFRRRFFVIFQILRWSFLPGGRQNLPGAAHPGRTQRHAARPQGDRFGRTETGPARLKTPVPRAFCNPVRSQFRKLC